MAGAGAAAKLLGRALSRAGDSRFGELPRRPRAAALSLLRDSSSPCPGLPLVCCQCPFQNFPSSRTFSPLDPLCEEAPSFLGFLVAPARSVAGRFSPPPPPLSGVN